MPIISVEIMKIMDERRMQKTTKEKQTKTEKSLALFVFLFLFFAFLQFGENRWNIFN